MKSDNKQIEDESTSMDTAKLSQRIANIPYVNKAQIEQHRRAHPNAYAEWSDKDDDKLIELVNMGYTIPKLMKYFGRSRYSIESRIKRLDIIY